MNKHCDHFTVGVIHGKVKICLMSVVYDFCRSLAKMYWVGNGEPPAEEKDKILKEFKRFKYCPKCGEKLCL